MSTVVLSPKLLGSIPLNALQLCVLLLRNHGCGIQECFGALLQKYGDAVLKEELGEDTTREAKAPKLKGGKGNGRPHNEASRDTQPRRGRQPNGSPPSQDLSQVVKALARLALQQETSIKELRQDIPGGTTVEAESAKGSRGSATEKYAHHVLARAPAQAPGQPAGAATHQSQGEQLAQGWEVAVPDLESIIGSPDCGRAGPTPEPRCGSNVVQADPAPRDPFHGQLISCQWGTQGDEQQSRGFSTGDLKQDSWMPGCVASYGEAQRPISTSIDRHPAEARFTSTVAGRGCSSEALSRIRQLKLLNSNNTCYLNAFVLSWLHGITQTGCTEYAAFRSRSQAWRDVLYSGKPLHVHALLSWQGILEGWPDVHRQHDAGERLEHWVAAGRPQVLSGRWEARIAEGMLVEIRHFATTMSPINLDLPASTGTISLQQLVLEWHANQLGIQALADAPQLLMIRLMRFTRRANQTCKNTASVAIPTTVQMPVFDGASLQCSFVAYRVSTILMHTGHTPHAAHYTARQWSTDDGRTARPFFRAVEHDPQVLVQGYVLLLCRGTCRGRH